VEVLGKTPEITTFISLIFFLFNFYNFILGGAKKNHASFIGFWLKAQWRQKYTIATDKYTSPPAGCYVEDRSLFFCVLL
jgi:hypothetical protein